MCAGLRIEDEAALLEAKKEGAELMARTDDAIVYGYTKDYATGRVLVRITFRDKLSFIRTSDPEPVNIDAALAQIAEMKAAQSKQECPYCSTDAFERVGIANEEFDVRPRVYLCGGNCTPPINERFVYCPMCARKLIEEEK